MDMSISLPQSSRNKRLLQGVALAAAALLLTLLLLILGMRLYYLDRVFPGVYTGSLDLSGLTRADLNASLDSTYTYAQDGVLILVDREDTYVATPVELGVIVDTPAMAEAALAVGRSGGWLQRLSQQVATWTQGYEIPALILWDEWIGRSYLANLATYIDQPTIEATLDIDGLEVISVPGQTGRELQVDAALEAIRAPVSRLHDSTISLPIVEVEPLVADTSEAASRVRTMLQEPFELHAEGSGPWSFEPEELAQLLEFKRITDGDDAYYAVEVSGERMRAFLEELAPDLEREAENARFIFNDDTLELDLLEPAIIARSLNLSASLEAINTALNDGEHAVELVFETQAPQVGDDATATDLRITEAVSVVSTYFNGSSQERIQNIATAASEFHGLLIPPGATLSMAEILGDISLDNGYAEALIIYGDRTILGVGGGVCQVSTTLFRAAFFGGYPIDERHSHAYRVGYYEQGPGSPGPGLDATVFVPTVDFRFTNDTPYWLLLETYLYGNQLLWKFYSTSDGRTVEWSSNTSDVVEAPEPLYRENDELPEGEIEQVDFEADGMTVIAYRTVRRDGEVLHQDTFTTRYRPWRAIYEYGPGTELPSDARTE